MNRSLTVRPGDSGVITPSLGSHGQYTFEGDFTFDVSDLDHYVQVKFLWSETGGALNPGAGSTTFRDPSGQVVPGVYVKVPYPGADWAVAKVIAVGRGSDLPVDQAGVDLLSVLTETVLS